MIVKWQKDMAFQTQINGHELVMDASEQVGGHDGGPRPKPLLLAALCGCTGMDVVSILKKMKVKLDAFEMDIEAEQTEEHPKVYKHITLIYRFKGNDLDDAKLKRAVELSQDKYCGVSAMLKKAVQLDYRIEVAE